MLAIIAFALPLHAVDVNVGTFEELQTTISNFNNNATENMTITISTGFDISANLAVANANYTLTIKSDIIICTRQWNLAWYERIIT